jgi:hypothetical protein
VVCKLSRTTEAITGLEREAENLRALDGRRASSIPSVLFIEHWGERAVLAETALVGRPLYTALGRRNHMRLALAVTEWLGELAGDATPQPGDDIIEPALGSFRRRFGPVVEHDELIAAETLLGKLPPLPRVPEQRDCSPWNVLVDERGRIAVSDWESAVPRGLPFLDLTYFLAYTTFFVEGAMASGRCVEAYRASRDPRTPVGHVGAECEQRYLCRVGLAAALTRPLRLLTWMVHAESEHARLAADSGGEPGVAALQESLFVSLWREELRRS